MAMRCICSQIVRWAASSGASNHWSRRVSSRGLVGQPNQPSSPLPRIGRWLAGLATVMPSYVVQKMPQPPLSGGSLLARRCTRVPQSVLT